MDVSSRHSIAELQERQKQTNDAYLFRNLRIIILAQQGWTAPSIGMALDLSRRVVQQRVYDYNEQGLSALEEQRGTPPRPLLTPDQEQVLGPGSGVSRGGMLPFGNVSRANVAGVQRGGRQNLP